jgi:hypothetical protein
VIVTATANGVNQTATVSVTAPTALTLTIAPTSVEGGVANATGTLTISGQAPTGGYVVTCSSSNVNVATVPGTITVAAGQTIQTFTITTKSVTTRTTVIISCTVNGSTASFTFAVTL